MRHDLKLADPPVAGIHQDEPLNLRGKTIARNQQRKIRARGEV
jgi:hypothetical protein